MNTNIIYYLFGVLDEIVDNLAESHACLVDFAAAVDAHEQAGDFVEVDDGLGFLLVFLEAVADGVDVGIVGAAGDEGALVNAADELVARGVDGDDAIHAAAMVFE